jgi:hypothetical protein
MRSIELRAQCYRIRLSAVADASSVLGGGREAMAVMGPLLLLPSNLCSVWHDTNGSHSCLHKNRTNAHITLNQQVHTQFIVRSYTSTTIHALAYTSLHPQHFYTNTQQQLAVQSLVHTAVHATIADTFKVIDKNFNAFLP